MYSPLSSLQHSMFRKQHRTFVKNQKHPVVPNRASAYTAYPTGAGSNHTSKELNVSNMRSWHAGGAN
jgi:hypothetical protein